MNPNLPDSEKILSDASIPELFVAARKAGACFKEFPGVIPENLVTGYAYQDEAIKLWPDTVAGWKLGYIAPNNRDISNEDRLVGPIFSRAIQYATNENCIEFPVFSGGFAAVEAEFVFRLGDNADPNKIDWTPDEAAKLVSALHIGVEIAGSPLATINHYGPSVVVSDFGNNSGLLLGPEIPGWQHLDDTVLTCETYIEGTCVGTGGSASIPGGLLSALCFALNRCARRGHPLQAGALITTGAATGIHDIIAGQQARLSFGQWGSITCRAIAAARVSMTR